MALLSFSAFSPSRPVRLVVLVLLLYMLLSLLPLPSTIALPGFSFLSSSSRRFTVDVVKHINPLIGTVNGGHVFPGPTLPYGLAKPCPDSMSPGENAAGYVSDLNPISGFSQLHDSGTGGSASMGNFPIFAHPGCVDDDYTKCAFTITSRMLHKVNDSAEARPGYFALNLTNTVRAEMTASMHATLYRFTFSPNQTVHYDVYSQQQQEPQHISAPSSPLLLVDLNDLSSSRSTGGCQVYPESGRMVGDGVFSPSFGKGKYSAYFCADFRGSKIRHAGTYIGQNITTDPTYLSQVTRGYGNPSGSGGTWIQFEQSPNNQILARVGLSFISVEQACQNAEREIPTFNFDKTVRAAEAAWREKLSVIQVDPTGVSDELQTVFWSGIYRSLVSPQNYTGENQLWTSSEPYFDSFYCIWDSFRAQHPLLAIIDPVAQQQMVRTLLDIYRYVGKLPDCRMSFNKGFTQGGSNADVVLVDTYIKNITEGIDWDTAYAATLSDAEITPADWSVEGRGNIESWLQYGYIAADHRDKVGTGPHSRSVSRTVEYAYDDFCIATLAQELGYEEDVTKYMNRSGFWKNVWNPDQQDLYKDQNGEFRTTQFRGFMQPRLMNGSFKYQSTRRCSPNSDPHNCYFDTYESTYEGSPWLYSFYAPHDMAGLIDTYGGKDAFIERLNFYHSSEIVYMGNEQSYLTVFQFHYGGRPGLSSYWVNEYIPNQFNASINGIPGNDDCAMGAFTAFAMMGFFPVAGQSVYLLTTPFFNEVKLQSRTGRLAIIRKVETEPGMQNIYIQSAKLNGRRYTRNWISHEFFYHGGVLELEVGSRESDWGTHDEDLPPSYPPHLPPSFPVH